MRIHKIMLPIASYLFLAVIVTPGGSAFAQQVLTQQEVHELLSHLRARGDLLPSPEVPQVQVERDPYETAREYEARVAEARQAALVAHAARRDSIVNALRRTYGHYRSRYEVSFRTSVSYKPDSQRLDFSTESVFPSFGSADLSGRFPGLLMHPSFGLGVGEGYAIYGRGHLDRATARRHDIMAADPILVVSFTVHPRSELHNLDPHSDEHWGRVFKPTILIQDARWQINGNTVWSAREQSRFIQRRLAVRLVTYERDNPNGNVDREYVVLTNTDERPITMRSTLICNSRSGRFSDNCLNVPAYTAPGESVTIAPGDSLVLHSGLDRTRHRSLLVRGGHLHYGLSHLRWNTTNGVSLWESGRRIASYPLCDVEASAFGYLMGFEVSCVSVTRLGSGGREGPHSGPLTSGGPVSFPWRCIGSQPSAKEHDKALS